ncbi:hypothetical protein ACVXHB_24580, partial [Escherichia coli]
MGEDKLARFQQPVRWLTLPPELKNGGIKISRQALRAGAPAIINPPFHFSFSAIPLPLIKSLSR